MIKKTTFWLDFVQKLHHVLAQEHLSFLYSTQTRQYMASSLFQCQHLQYSSHRICISVYVCLCLTCDCLSIVQSCSYFRAQAETLSMSSSTQNKHIGLGDIQNSISQYRPAQISAWHSSSKLSPKSMSVY